MRKIFLVSLVVMAASVALVAFAGDIPENITIDQCADKKSAVEFPHAAHFELAACTDCHHTSEGLTAENAAEMEVATCGSCHIDPEEADTPACSEMSSKKNPYHISCMGCHKDMKKAAKAEGKEFDAPTSCKACHPKADA